MRQRTQSGWHSVAISRRNATPLHSTLKAPPPLYTPKHTLVTSASGSSALLLSVSTKHKPILPSKLWSVLCLFLLCACSYSTMYHTKMCSRNKHIVNSEFAPKLVCYNYVWVLCQCYLILYFCILYLKKHYNLLWPDKCCSVSQPPRQA